MFPTGLRPRARSLLAGLLLAQAGCGDQKVSPGGGQTGRPAGGVPGFQLPDAGPTPPASAPPNRQCVEESHQAESLPLDLLLLVDSSGSMNAAVGASSKWVMVGNALRAFIHDPRSAGLGMGLQFFPASSLDRPCLTDADCGGGMFQCMNKSVCAGPGAPSPGVVCNFTPRVSAPGLPPVPIPVIPGTATCSASTKCVLAGLCSATADECTNIGEPCPAGGGTCEEIPRICRTAMQFDQCEPVNYQKAAVAIAPLPMAEVPLTRALASRIPNGDTPMAAAVAGALGQLRAQLAADPRRKAVLVLASDGVPSDCPGAAASVARIDIVSALGEAFKGTPSIRTYVIGVFSAGEMASSGAVMDRFAAAGGTDKAFVVSTSNDLTQRLQESLDHIRGAALACEYQIPTPSTGRIDFGQVNVRYTGLAGPENIPYVERPERCDPARGGWYYDTPPGQGVPTRILMCDATCRRFTAETSARVELVFGCATIIQ